MDEHFNSIDDTSSLDELFTRAQSEPVVLFKHDPYCSISSHAYQEMQQVPGEIVIIDVAHDKDVARAVQERTGVKHESPQVIVLRNGQAVWSASHWAITASAVKEAALLS